MNFENIKKMAIIIIIMLAVSCKKDSTSYNNNNNNGHIPVFTGFSPAAGLPGTGLILSGSNFNTNNINVTINGVLASLLSATSTQLVIQVPSDATSGKIQVTTNGITLTSSSDFVVKAATYGLFSSYSVSIDYRSLQCIAINKADNIYGIDYYSNGINNANDSTRLVKFTPSGTFSAFGPQWPVSDLSFVAVGIAVDASGNVFVTDLHANKIYKIAPDGSQSTFAGSGLPGLIDGQGIAAQFAKPRDLAMDGSGNLYVIDLYCVRKITPGGLVSTLAGSGTLGNKDGIGNGAQFGQLRSIAVDASNNVYVSEYGRIAKITPNGTVTTIAGNGTVGYVDGAAPLVRLGSPLSLTVDTAGNVFFLDGYIANNVGYGTMRVLSSSGVVTTFLKAGTNTYGQLNKATIRGGSIVFDSKGNMYVMGSNGDVLPNIYSCISKLAFN